MKQLITMLIAVVASAAVQAQTKPGSISGTITNNENKAVDAATVQLLKATDKSLVKIAVSDKAGNFAFDKLPEGKYLVSITAVGFTKKITSPVEINAANTAIVITDAKLLPQAKGLSEVTVVSNKQFIEQKPDRMVVNVEASPSNAGATALEVLEKSPGVTVDNDGNISLKGKQGVIIMMDGKPTYLSGADLANVLRNLPASALDQIEIMTNPSSKYDASGNSGLINIKTKKNKAKGSNGSIAVGTTNSLFRKNGTEEMTWKPSVSVNYNYKKNKINFFTNGVYNYREGRGELNIVSRYYRDNKAIDSINNVNTFFRFRNNNYTLKTGLDFTPDKKNSFGIVLNGFLFAGRPHPVTNTTYTTLDGVPFSRLNTENTNKLSWNNFGANFNFRHTFDSAGTELTLDLDYSRYNNTSDQNLSTGFFDGNYNKTADSMFLNGHVPSVIDIYSLKSDFVHTYKNGVRLETGIKSSYVTSDNLVEYVRKAGTTWVPDARNNHFVYTENVNAAYINVNKQFKKWNVQTGVRAENTNTKGVQAIDNSSVKRNYVSLFPTAFASYTINEKNSLTASVGRRLQRPNYQDLNPFTFFLDSLSYRQGNPYLTPQFSYNYELTHSYKGKLNTTLNYTTTTDVISQIINRKKGNSGEIIGFLTSDNIAKYTNAGIAISAPVKFTKWWNSSLYGNVYRNHYTGTYISNETGKPEVVDLDLAFTSFTLNVNNNFTIGKGWSAELSGFYRYKTIEQLSLSYPMGQLSIGLAKNNLLKGKGSLRLNARDPFNFQKYHGLTQYGTVDIDIRNRWDNRQYGVNFTYRFGKQQGQSRRRSATEDEQQRVGAGN
ncbi:TonB-dependent receptor domain-containing protein [Ferruginibacter sp. SUN106]|uniref:TonB-dependent receptor domain-containing protein n=1 Tax=Ferruginibacter sp. SUN106 TaxID=2978348 RepID=UPI003D360B75